MKPKVTAFYLFTIIVILLGISIITGCSGKSGNTEPLLDNNSESVLSENGLTIQVADSFGQVVEVPVGVERVATLYAFTGHVTTLLALQRNVILFFENFM